MKRILALTLALTLLLGLLPLPAAAETRAAFGTAISRGLTLSEEHVRLSSGALRRAFTLEYAPDSGTTPLVLYGQKLYGKSTVNEVVAYAQSLGYTVMAAVNADYFNLETGLPTGMTIQNGRLVTSDAAWNAVGFRADGTAIAGTPKLRLTLTRADGTTTPIYALNKVRTTAGLYLYSPDFSGTTRTVNAGYEAVLQLNAGDFLAVGRTVTATVLSVEARAATPLAENQLVLSLADANTLGLSLADLAVGSAVTLTAAAEPGWEEVLWSTGGGNLLVRDGVLTADAVSGADPRTVLGVRPDGSTVIYVCDGRQSALSSGISTREAAQLLLDDGCTTVVCMDGGGSTALSARWPGQETSALQNSPSDGAPRAGATYILFVNSGDPTLPASRAAVYPRSAAILAGGTLSLSALTCNDDFFPTGAYDDLYDVSAGEGYVVGNTLYTPVFADTIDVAVAAPGLRSDPASYTVVEAPAALRLVLRGGDTALTSLALSPGEVMDLDVWATDGLRRLVSQDTQFAFALSPTLGTVDAEGVVTAGMISGVSGTLTASFGGQSVTLKVTVGRAPQVLEDFESGALWTAQAAEGLESAAALNTAVENSRYGHNSLALTAEGAGDAAVFTADRALTLPAGAQTVSLLMRGAGSLRLDFRLNDGTTASVPLAAATGDWQYRSAVLPAGAAALTGVTALGADGAVSCQVWLDQLMVHFGPAANDLHPPVLNIQPFDGLVLTAFVSDNYAFPVEQRMLSVRLDGAELPFTYNADTGELVCAIPQSAGTHRITVSARDYFLNYTRQSLVFGETAAYTYTDLSNHWCADYAEYLRLKGLFDSVEHFNPTNLVNNAMAATLISRYLGVDTSLYADVELPYADLADIPDWALPHVKAMYAQSIIMGSVVNGQRVLLPYASCSRAQIMTILGRTFGRGFSYEQAQFSDFDAAPAWAKDHISLLSSVGIVDGYGGSTGAVRPTGTITRAEFASLLFKMY